MARILVTGGLGVVGTWLVRELRERHHDVISCDLAHQPDEVAFGLQGDLREPRYARCDIGEFRQLARLFEHFGRFDYVFHCAAEFGRWNGEDFYETLWRTNVIGTKHLLRLQESQRFRLVHFSSSEVYGDYPHLMVEHITDEVEIKQLNDYAMSKWVNEMQIRNAIAQHGVESVVVRLFNTYGPGEYYSPYRSVNCRFLYCALHGLPWTVYRGHARTSTFLADTIRTVANLVEHFKPGETYNIGGDQLHTIEELSDLVLKVTGASPTLVRYADAEPLTTKVKLVDTSKAVRDLGHRSTYSLEEGLRLTADWMRQVYKLSK
ncbi:NAD(P)-dependent oxidoreductase [Chloracidobacterium aggregatum]|jgi:dTDP-glucose 4,6-dehydratase|uniref:NAD(P)-dependent oxidoreductase n=1 Tax=Chloracidobacterium sp. N TaxID=2821540 RepID=A0ABX8B0T0_9BACT|nr:NAD(P)-dependent oxidoreductase [Chloracidobacterium aggregatum]QUV85098.1 NAD(P)-dependent oxidoreductase [Chloracidobacterium sp. 2]QUV88502.1 NAD(P)-dependent oxidoreductase [Chloracidobacterium sp. S]QUV91425.1 NAD(P)-dependent oxidoreductase [Chloracidobacterium sp. A]QUV94600.1 NAD(P)-dependent oxidoreductase [Chloracidobacterium sp. N]QUV97803.1 NAD(P)-dependent oxidoreductase [Chloracidobacterium sp. E]